ncbi:MAG: TetR/AcrR family transcriptional regulator [Treponema sp.]|jgi:AcrR family transcriptional regulator|nr:TetR/AcrR family transcriptional regulator [Treponema sp.]
MNRREKQKAETFVDIMRSAEELFMRQGYEKTSMQEIADNSGLTKGALYHHFASKEALLERMCADHYGALLRAVQPVLESRASREPRDSCFSRLRRVLELSRGMGMSAVTFVSEYLKVRKDESSLVLKDRLRKYDRKFYVDLVAPLLKEAKEKKECDFAASAEVLAVFIHRLDRGVDEEIRGVFAEHSRAEAEKLIIDIMKTYVYCLSRILNTQPQEVSVLISLEETMHFYGEVLRKSKN